jgi:transcriptional regulator with XRE-family HTH domain
MEEGTRTVSPFGARLRLWRRHRGVSQLALATQVGTTARHLSFLETGRSRPSRQMVLRLGGALGVPVRERNELLRAAGLPVAYPERELSDVGLAPFRAVIDRILTAHLPYPGLVVDSRWNVLLANPACAALYGGDIVGANMVRRFFADPAVSAVHVVNWPQVAWTRGDSPATPGDAVTVRHGVGRAGRARRTRGVRPAPAGRDGPGAGGLPVVPRRRPGGAHHRMAVRPCTERRSAGSQAPHTTCTG